VVAEVAVGLEAFIAAREVTDIRLLACMYSHVDLQVSLFIEGLLANAAYERLLTGLKG
jgi:hypothetical protein